MANLLSLPVIGLALMIQLAVISRLPLLGGTADLVLVILVAWALQENVKKAWVWAIVGGVLVGGLSGLPDYVPLVSYVLVTILIMALRRRVWQVPILMLFLGIVLGTTGQHVISIAALFIDGNQLPVQDSLSWVTLPSILLNLIVALPIYAVITDLARLVNPPEVAV